MARICTIDQCLRKHYARGLCEMHYQRDRVHGSTDQRQRGKAMSWLLDAIERTTDDCIDWPFATSHGYGYMRHNNRSVGAHRIACTLVHGDPPVDRNQTAHSCGRSICVNPRHLRWATTVENQGDRLAHGTHNRGTRYGLHKLTEADVRAIRDRVARGERQVDVAADYPISTGTVSAIATRTTWAWLDQVAA